MGAPSTVDAWIALDAEERIAAIVEDPSICDFIAGDIESHRDLADERGRELLALRARVAELEETLRSTEYALEKAERGRNERESELYALADALGMLDGSAGGGPIRSSSATLIAEAVSLRDLRDRWNEHEAMCGEAYDDGAEAMRERAVQWVRSVAATENEERIADRIGMLPLTDDAREDGGSDDDTRR